MTNISTTEVRALARLSALRLTDEEATSLTNDLGSILEYFELLGELDTEGVEPTYYGTSLTNVSREDTVETSAVTREELISLSAGGVSAHQFKVSKVL